MAADRAGRAAGGVEQHRVGRRLRPPRAGVGADQPGAELEAVQVLFQAFQARRRELDRGHLGAGRGELGGLAARRGAEIDDRLAGERAEQAGRQGGGRILDPPGALAVARQRGDVAGAGRQAQAPGRQDRGAEPFGPGLGRLLHGQVEWRVGQVGLGDRPRAGRAVSGRPGAPEPVRRVEPGGVLCGGQLGRLPRGAAHDRVDQAAEAGQGLAARQRHRGVDRGVGRRLEEHQLAESEPQQMAQLRLPRLQRLVQEAGVQRVELAQPAQGLGHQLAQERPVARRQAEDRRLPRPGLVEGALAVEHGAQQAEREGPRVGRPAPVSRLLHVAAGYDREVSAGTEPKRLPAMVERGQEY